MTLAPFHSILTGLEKLSRSRWNYLFRFYTDGATGLVLAFFGIWIGFATSGLAGLGLAAAGFLTGILAQGFIEYFFHRWLFHRILSTFARGHDEHHQAPRAYVAMPFMVTQLIFAALWIVFFLLSGSVVFAHLATAGVVFRFLWYGALHHSFHHFDFSSRLWRRMRAYHAIHHRLPDRNYGLTGVFWDRLLGTHYRSPRYARQAAGAS